MLWTAKDREAAAAAADDDDDDDDGDDDDANVEAHPQCCSSWVKKYTRSTKLQTSDRIPAGSGNFTDRKDCMCSKFQSSLPISRQLGYALNLALLNEDFLIIFRQPKI